MTIFFPLIPTIQETFENSKKNKTKQVRKFSRYKKYEQNKPKQVLILNCYFSTYPNVNKKMNYLM